MENNKEDRGARFSYKENSARKPDQKERQTSFFCAAFVLDITYQLAQHLKLELLLETIESSQQAVMTRKV